MSRGFMGLIHSGSGFDQAQFEEVTWTMVSRVASPTNSGCNVECKAVLNCSKPGKDCTYRTGKLVTPASRKAPLTLLAPRRSEPSSLRHGASACCYSACGGGNPGLIGRRLAKAVLLPRRSLRGTLGTFVTAVTDHVAR